MIKYQSQVNVFVCETLDEIHDAQLALVISRLRKKSLEKPIAICAN